MTWRTLSSAYNSSSNMTDRFNSFSAMMNSEVSESEKVSKHFLNEFRSQTLVLQKWISSRFALTVRKSLKD